MAIPWIVGGIIAAGVAAIVASDDSSSSSSSSARDLERERVRARLDNERKKEAAVKLAKDQRIASENKAKAQRFITKHKLTITPEELLRANKQDNQLSLQAMNNYNNKASVRGRNREIELLEQELEGLDIVEKELLRTL
ncbi:hypothetical protein [Vibrio cyclitrophicus]|uniref:hypothetical protein n=1 Tax=Vibrio cyclitrophicus TaxID=47951 RepID=UPI0002D8A5F3|nr:hypothetical protein [Vibrio cyclitrophicus]OEF26209.1 hypothetical protein OA9_15300 [Vibrio cyclitrophicus 1F97]OEF48203.1 hypothetical protein OAC_05055 [Vibrio cyclitrophicus 1F273]OEF80516.1 hypothetical protein OA5_11275 [Vibrio cyclitrophicus 1F111]PMH22715.1 hypothetical protein BCU73_11555 [Vibrio cyclitrophicus]